MDACLHGWASKHTCRVYAQCRTANHEVSSMTQGNLKDGEKGRQPRNPPPLTHTHTSSQHYRILAVGLSTNQSSNGVPSRTHWGLARGYSIPNVYKITQGYRKHREGILIKHIPFPRFKKFTWNNGIQLAAIFVGPKSNQIFWKCIILTQNIPSVTLIPPRNESWLHNYQTWCGWGSVNYQLNLSYFYFLKGHANDIGCASYIHYRQWMPLNACRRCTSTGPERLSNTFNCQFGSQTAVADEDRSVPTQRTPVTRII